MVKLHFFVVLKSSAKYLYKVLVLVLSLTLYKDIQKQYFLRLGAFWWYNVLSNSLSIINELKFFCGLMCDPITIADIPSLSKTFIGSHINSFKQFKQKKNFHYFLVVLCYNKTDVMIKMLNRLRHFDQFDNEQQTQHVFVFF